MNWRLPIDDRVHLSEFRAGDKPALVTHLAAREIYDWTLRIPYPYTESDADAWLAISAPSTDPEQPVSWAIRDSGEQLIGCIGLSNRSPRPPREAELGYWLAVPYWGQGIMTAVVNGLCRFALDELDLTRIYAHVFASNAASARVLEKCGFRLEAFLPGHHVKEGRPIDAKRYARSR